jgi:hypothetical protein
VELEVQGLWVGREIGEGHEFRVKLRIVLISVYQMTWLRLVPVMDHSLVDGPIKKAYLATGIAIESNDEQGLH